MNPLSETIMNKFPAILLALILFLFTGLKAGVAQDQIAVPLSNPGQHGQLSLKMITGAVEVSGYEGDEVIIRHDSQHMAARDQDETRNGMQRLTRSGRGFEVQELNNQVRISGVSPTENISFEILVPYNFSLNISLVNGRKLHAEGVRGTLELNNVNGNITLENVGGSAVLNTVNGNIIATFLSVDPESPMAFSNVNGDIDITYPSDTQFNARMKSDLGDVFTDFDMDILNESGERTINVGTETISFSINRWIDATVNGGGPEYRFQTLRGDVLVRKGE